MKVEVWKHEETGKLFEEKSKYDKFAKGYEEGKKISQERAKIKRDFDAALNAPRLTATSIPDFAQKVMELWNKCHHHLGAVITSLEFERPIFKFSLSNSHNCPVGGVMNWCGNDKDKPKGYPGWAGNVHVQVNKGYGDHPDVYCIQGKDGKVRIPGFNTGSGGAREKNGYKYESFLYLSDFPLIEAKYKDAIQRKEDLEKEVEDMQDSLKAYNTRKIHWIQNRPEVMALRKEMDENSGIIQKAQLKQTILTQSIQHHMEEANAKFQVEVEQFDNARLEDLIESLKVVKSGINL